METHLEGHPSARVNLISGVYVSALQQKEDIN